MLFLLSISCGLNAQNVPLYQAKEKDFVIISGKTFVVIKDDGNVEQRKRINDFFYIDRVDRDADSVLKAVHLTDGKEVQFSIGFDTEHVNSYDELSRNASIMVCDTCDPKGYYVAYICNDSLAFGSSHPSRPFKYGFNYTYEQCQQFIRDIEFLNLQPGQNIASVGAASGVFEGAFSVNTENIHYTIEDVNKYILNEKEFNGMVNHFTSVRGKPQTNTFDFVLGNFDSTCLPRNKFDKIIVRNAYHEFDKKWKMINDLKTKIKPDGEIILLDEGFSSMYYTYYHDGCGVRALKANDVIRFFGEQGLYLVKMKLPMNSLENNLIFSTDKTESESYMNSLETVNEFIFSIDRLNTSAYASHEDYITGLEIVLKMHLNQIHETYDSLHFYLSDIGSIWVDQEKYEYALPILNMSNSIYPNIAYTQFYLGITYYGLEDRSQGDIYFEKAIALDKEQKEAVEEFKKEWIEWWGE